MAMNFLVRLREAVVPTLGPRPRKIEESGKDYRAAVNRLKQVTRAIGSGVKDRTYSGLSGLSDSIDEADQLMRDALTSEVDDERKIDP